jgi:two-component system sensor histidine kinase PhoQ
MDNIIEYQLQKAAAKGEHKTIKVANVSVIINKIVASLTKVYHDKGIDFDITVSEPVLVYYEEGDLYEIIGNLLDNACKWCNHTVKINVSLNVQNRRNFSLMILIEDDGPGIPQEKLSEILKRGCGPMKIFTGTESAWRLSMN